MRKIVTKKDVDRLCALPAQDKTNLGVEAQTIRDEIGRALERHARNREHLDRIVEQLVYQRWRPGAADVQVAAELTITDADRAAEMVQKADPACLVCSGTGWEPVSRAGLSGVRRCACITLRRRGDPDPAPIKGEPVADDHARPGFERISDVIERSTER